MQKVQKSQLQAEAERQEANKLALDIIAMSNRIPAYIRNEASHGEAVVYKQLMAAALKVADGKQLNVHKLRAAHSTIVGYYNKGV